MVSKVNTTQNGLERKQVHRLLPVRLSGPDGQREMAADSVASQVDVLGSGLRGLEGEVDSIRSEPVVGDAIGVRTLSDDIEDSKHAGSVRSG